MSITQNNASSNENTETVVIIHRPLSDEDKNEYHLQAIAHFSNEITTWLKNESFIRLTELLNEIPKLAGTLKLTLDGKEYSPNCFSQLGIDTLTDLLSDEPKIEIKISANNEIEGIIAYSHHKKLKYRKSVGSNFYKWPHCLSDEELAKHPKPFDLNLFNLDIISSRHLPEPLRSFTKSLSKSAEVDQSICILSALAAVSAVVSRKFHIEVKPDWSVPLNIYVMGLAEPGCRKSHILSMVNKPIQEWEQIKRIEFDQTYKRSLSMRKTAEKALEKKRETLIKSGKATNDEMLKLAEEEANLPNIPTVPYLIVNDVTNESLTIACEQQGGKIFISSAEGGIMQTLCGAYSDGRANLDIILKGYDGEEIRQKRKDRDIYIRPSISICLLIQHEVFINLTHNKLLQGNGFFERFIYAVIPPDTLKTQTSDSPPVPKEINESYKQLIEELFNIPMLKSDLGIDIQRRLTLDSEAHKVRLEFDSMIRKEMLPDGELCSLKSWGAKLTGTLLRVAGILHVVEYKDKVSVINKETMLAAKDLTTKLISHAQSAHQLLAMDERQKNARIILEWMTKNCQPMYSTTQIRRGLRNRNFLKQRTRDYNSPSKLDDALSFLLDMNILIDVQIDNTGCGRPTTYYITNPRAFDDRVLYDSIGLPLDL